MFYVPGDFVLMFFCLRSDRFLMLYARACTPGEAVRNLLYERGRLVLDQ